MLHLITTAYAVYYSFGFYLLGQKFIFKYRDKKYYNCLAKNKTLF